METAKESKGLYIVLSLLVAIFLWLYVGSNNGQEEVNNIHNIPVVFTNLDTLEERGLMISDGAEQTISLEIKSTRSVALKLMEKGAMTAVVDVSKITSPNTYTTGFELKTPNNVTKASFSIVGTVRNITYTVARRSDRSVEVRGVFNGEVADGYQRGDFSITPGSIIVSGEEESVKQVDYAQVTLNRTDDALSSTFTSSMPFQLIGFDGQVLDLAGAGSDDQCRYGGCHASRRKTQGSRAGCGHSARRRRRKRQCEDRYRTCDYYCFRG